ncbi:LD-carboxypeptidase [Pigmentiphaga aceris]|uniref:LD-carboxypeptidase n=1 Tax=Pigmentiphaga aceris TaxID=1940612 RepID=A0A5C0AWC6_9BURK|nr:LD-carboxypeptidase [Pigmentiphaga aceris]QEI06689.1 LD-carboxypeptidase [Pigmentiphaga aceris]
MAKKKAPSAADVTPAHDHQHDHSHDHAHDHGHAHQHDHVHGDACGCGSNGDFELAHDGAYDGSPLPRKKMGIYMVSPSGAVDPEAIAKARVTLAEQGFKVSVDRAALLRNQRFAGTDAQRLAGLHRAATQKHEIVMATRGGYGLSRLLPQIDWKLLADSGKKFVGYSDFTALQLGLLAKTGAVSYAGPCAAGDFGGKKIDDLTSEIFAEVMHGELELLSFDTQDADPVDCRGILWGGNLAMVTALLGTPYMPKIKGGILFLEDVNEHPYSIERMFAQLLQAGVLAKQKAIVLGSFTEYRLTANDAGYDLKEAIAWLRRESGVPVITGLPFGHTPFKVTLPVGAKVGLATEDGVAHLVIDEHHHH